MMEEIYEIVFLRSIDDIGAFVGRKIRIIGVLSFISSNLTEAILSSGDKKVLIDLSMADLR
jgi:hypothetical protein